MWLGFQDSSSDSPADVSDLPEPALPPLPPGLPPEPPPAPPAPTTAATSKDKAEDMTVVTTYTSFVPVPNTPHNIPQPHQPMGYMNADMHQMPPYNNWMAPGMPMADMGPGMPHHMYPPPQMINNYDQFNGQPQQPFPFINQPPPPLPYQMQMPPPCHQHYRMPSAGPPPNINLINVCQDIKNLKSNPVILTPVSDNANKDLLPRSNVTHPIDTNSKCKHNPLGKNNQTIQEAIDTVRKCLKHCEGKNNKDPRLVPAESRKLSPESSATAQKLKEDKNKSDEKKVKITLNYKPRPVTNVEETCVFDAVGDSDVDCKTQGNDSNNKGKTVSYNEKSHKIEGIVSKLKDTMGSSASSEKEEFNAPKESIENPQFAKIQPMNKRTSGDLIQPPGCEMHNSINKQRNLNDSVNKTELPLTKSMDPTSVDQKTGLSDTDFNEINAKIGTSFSFILSHSIDRKRLTPTLASINANKKESNDTVSSVSNQCKGLRKVRKIKKPDKVNDTVVELSTSVPSTASTAEIKTTEIVGQEENQKSLYTPQPSISKGDLTSFQHVIKESVAEDKSEVNIKDKNVIDSIKSEDKKLTAKDSATNKQEVEKDLQCRSDISTVNVLKEGICARDILKKEEKKDIEGDKVIIKNNIKCENNLNNEQTSINNNTLNESSKSILNINLKSESNGVKEPNDEICNKILNNETSNNLKKECSSDVESSSVKIMENQNIAIPEKASQKFTVESSSEPKEKSSTDKMGSIERKSLPQLSIPTKGELKRFPTPERTFDHESSKPVITSSKKVNKSDPKWSKDVTDCNNDIQNTKIPDKSNVSKSVVESILQDFEDSNSAGSDYDKSCKLEQKSQCKGGKLTEKEVLDDISKQNTITNEEGLNKGCSIEVDTKNIGCLLSEEIKPDNITNDSNPEKDCLHKSHFNLDANNRNNSELLKTNSKLNENNSIDLNATSEDMPPKLSAISPLKLFRKPTRSLSKLKSKPCPLSKKSKSYISKHLPLSFNLSADGHLIRRGFRKLRIVLSKVKAEAMNENTFEKVINIVDEPELIISNSEFVEPVPIENSTVAEEMERNSPKEVSTIDNQGLKNLQVNLPELKPEDESKPLDSLPGECTNSAEEIQSSLNTCSDVTDSNLSLSYSQENLKRPAIYSEDVRDKNVKGRSKKKVSFNLNINEIKITYQHSVGEDVESDVDVSKFTKVDPANINESGEILDENQQCSNPTKYADTVFSKNDTVCIQKDVAENHIEKTEDACEEDKNKSAPFAHINKKETTAITLPQTNDVREEKELDCPKRVTKRKRNKKSSKEPDKYITTNKCNENEQAKDKLPDNCNRLNSISETISCDYTLDTHKNNNSTLSGKNESDNEDSVILDRELSDLAKGCLDSDSTIEGDDDSVLNFGIVASDKSSLEGECELGSKNVPKITTRHLTKLSSSHSMKKRFSNKFKSLDRGLTSNSSDDQENNGIAPIHQTVKAEGEECVKESEITNSQFVINSNTVDEDICLTEGDTKGKSEKILVDEDINKPIKTGMVKKTRRGRSKKLNCEPPVELEDPFCELKIDSIEHSEVTGKSVENTDGHRFIESSNTSLNINVNEVDNSLSLNKIVNTDELGYKNYKSEMVVSQNDDPLNLCKLRTRKSKHSEINFSNKIKETNSVLQLESCNEEQIKTQTNEDVEIGNCPEVSGQSKECHQENSCGKVKTQVKGRKKGKKNIDSFCEYNDVREINVDDQKYKPLKLGINNNFKVQDKQSNDSDPCENEIIQQQNFIDHSVDTESNIIGKTRTRLSNKNMDKESKDNSDLALSHTSLRSKDKLRKTRSSQRIKGNQITETVDSTCVSLTKKHRSKKNVCNITNKTNCVGEETIDESINKSDDKNLEEDFFRDKEPLTVSRTLSTESSDEPLIVIKQKLMADKQGEFPINTNGDNPIEKNINTNVDNILLTENILSNVKSCVTDCSNRNERTTGSQSNKLNENEEPKNTRSDNNGSNLNTSDFSNPGLNNKVPSSLNNENKGTKGEDLIDSTPLENEEIHITCNINSSISPCVTSSVRINNVTVHPKLKEALRKKRDKAEVDAEIKKRLAEIDELEMLARSQHANVLEKIGARTRSKTLVTNRKRSVDDVDVVSISSDDSESTSVDTNDTGTAFTTAGDINKTEDTTSEEPTTTQDYIEKTTVVVAHDSKENKSDSNTDFQIKKGCNTNKRIRSKRSESNCLTFLKGKETVSQESDKDAPDNLELKCSETDLAREKVVDQVSSDRSNCDSPDTGALETSVPTKKDQKQNKKKSSEKANIITIENSSSISEPIKRARRNVLSTYQFKESDNDVEQSEEIDSKLSYTRSCKNKQVNQKNIKDNLSLKLSEGNGRKTRHKPGLFDLFSDKNIDSSRDSSSCNIVQKNDCYDSVDFPVKSTNNKSIISEPDSSTSTFLNGKSSEKDDIEKSQPDSLNIINDNSSTLPEESSVESSQSNLCREADTFEESVPVDGFRHPYRKSLVNRRKRRRRTFNERCSTPNMSLVSSPDEVDSSSNNDPTSLQSEEIVSSSVGAIKVPSSQTKKKRKRKTHMDLLMEDSMLSVTRDFPMSPNPYIMPSFYKDIDITNSSNKTNTSNELCVPDQVIKKLPQSQELPPKPDILAQKLRILEKLKSISRKSRKTRQCRTLVCYNEDSLPESLVESPVSETTHVTSDGGLSTQELNIINEQDCNKKEVANSSDVSSAKPKNGSNEYKNDLEEHTTTVTTNVCRKRGPKPKLSKPQLKSLRRNKLKLRWQDKMCPDRELKENIDGSLTVKSCDDSQLCKNLNVHEDNEIKTDNNEELSEFDKLLMSSTNNLMAEKDDNHLRPSIITTEEDKHSESSNDCHASLSSPNHNEVDEESHTNMEGDRECTKVNLSSPSSSNCRSENSKSVSILKQQKILCSILKSKLGKMLPYFGDSSTDEDEFDENIPLSVKLSQSCKKSSLPISEVHTSLDQRNIPLSQGSRSPPPRRSRRNQKDTNFVASISDLDTKKLINPNSVLVNDENINLSSEETNKTDTIPLITNDTNIEITPSLRKSARRQKPNIISCPENADSVVKSTGCETNEKRCESNSDKGTDRVLFPKKRGRPAKIKQNCVALCEDKVNQENPSAVFNNNGGLNFESKEDFYLKKNKGRNCNFQGEDIFPESITDPLEVQTNVNAIEPFNIFKVPSGPKTNDLDTETKKSISSQEKTDNNMEVSEDNENDLQKVSINPSELKTKDISFEDLPLVERLCDGNKACVKDQRNKKIKSSIVNIGNFLNGNDDSDENLSQFEYPNNNEQSYNESPPSLIKTRTRRPRVRTSENAYPEPPNLENPFTLTEENEKITVDGCNIAERNVECCNHQSNLEFHEVLLNTKKIKNSKRSTDTVNNDDTNTSKIGKEDLVLPTNQLLEEYEDDKDLTKIPVLDSALNQEEKHPLHRKRKKRGKSRLMRKRKRQNFNLIEKEIDSEGDSDLESRVPKLITYSNDAALATENNVPLNDNLKDNAMECNEELNNTSNNEEIKTGFMKEDAKKRKLLSKLKFKTLTETSDMVCNQFEESGTMDPQDNLAKMSKTDDINKVEEKPVTTLDSSSPVNSYEQPTGSLPPNCITQTFLWNKISGFLNKTTRSVGTQVKVKNMALKGFDTSEPVVSLQSELTLPQVIKTLYEEFKTLDSSFLNP